MTTRLLVMSLLVTLACGDAPSTPPDSRQTACMTSTVGEITTYPGQLTGTTRGGGADLTAPEGTCGTETEDAWFEPRGEDVVIRLAGLTAGTPYVVSLTTEDDLAFYVTSDCPPPSGAVSACLNFTDVSFTDERGAFVATGPEHFLVIDASDVPGPPETGEFTVSVDIAACTEEIESTACAAPTPRCVDFTCVQCKTSFDCRAETPVCSADHRCVAGPSGCSGDDAGEDGGDDGPAGARDLTTTATRSGSICAMPGEEDWYEVTVPAGVGLDVRLAWNGMTNDLDLYAYDATGRLLGLSFYRSPETVRLTYLPAGTYFLRVTKFASQPSSMSTAYTITATQTAAQSCTTSADCAAEFATQLFRGNCTAGVCEHIPAGSRANGVPCDSADDCLSGVCSYVVFEADAHTSVCTTTCATSGDCAAIGPGLTCTSGFQANLCVPSCTTDLECGALTNSSMIAPGQPWDYMTCTAATGVCSP